MNKRIYRIAVCGSASSDSREINRAAYKIGKTIAQEGHILFTGATLGFSYEAVKGAKAVGGVRIGVSPAEDKSEQLEKYEKINPALWTTIIYTGVGYKMRDIIMIRSVDAAIYVGGGVGTLLEMAAAVDYRKVMGVLKGSGGATDLYPDITRISHRNIPRWVVEENPEVLINRVIKTLKGIDE